MEFSFPPPDWITRPTRRMKFSFAYPPSDWNNSRCFSFGWIKSCLACFNFFPAGLIQSDDGNKNERKSPTEQYEKGKRL